jgi:hypothetical protein
MTNKLLTFSLALASLALCAGCLTSKQTSVTQGASGPVTNTVTVVNQANLLLDSSVLQGATAIAVSVAVQKDPSVVPALKDAQTALTGILNGASTNSASQILSTLGQSSNPALAAEITPLVGTVSGLEQSLLAKYGTNVTGQITIALAKAVNAGFATGLAGH